MLVIDVNDHDPEWVDGGAVKVVDVVEGNRVGQIISRVTATDRDEGDNARLRYSLRPVDDTPDNALDILPDSGQLVATTQFDYESRRQYR